MSSELLKKNCTPCKSGTPPLSEEKAQELYSQLEEGWYIEENHHIEKEYSFPDFSQALSFTNTIGMIAEREGHHPDIFLGWGRVFVLLSTHMIDGLSVNDFILAAKIDEAYSKR